MSPPDQPPVTRVSHYRVLYRLGAGGMGEVYAGLDETLKRRVALKVIHRTRRLDASARARFRREAQILSQLDHPNICRVYDYVEGDDHDWLVLELIEGRGLDHAVEGLDAAGRLRLAQQITDVLVATHAAGIVHRDLKPGNVLVTTGDQVKVLDFGLAQVAAPVELAPRVTEDRPFDPGDPDTETTHLASDSDTISPIEWTAAPVVSHSGGITGTLSHMSPEQARGEPATAASDMYSFGIVLQEILSGQPPYRADVVGAALLDRKRRGDLDPPPASLGRHLVSLVTRLTALAPSQRPTAVETAERLRWIRDQPKRLARRLVAAAIVLAFIGGGAKYVVDVTTQRNLADQRRGQAETLISFMLGDLRGKLLQAGRLELLEDVGREALDYFAAVPADELSTAEVAQRAKAIRQIGQIRQAQNQLPVALEAYRQSLALATMVAAREPANPAWQFELGNAHFYVGDALRRMRNLDAAMVEFEAYRDVARGLVERDPDNVDWQLELSYGAGGVAAILEAQSKLAEARTALEQAQAIKEDLARREPSRLDWQLAVATGHNRLGVVVEKLGDTAARHRHFLADVEIRRRLVEASPNNLALKRPFVVALSFLARAATADGDLAEAEALHREAFEVASAMAANDPANVDWRRDAAATGARLADLEAELGRLESALAHHVHAVAVLGPIAASDRTNTIWQKDAAAAELSLAQTRHRLGDDAAALRGAEAAVALLAPVLAKGPDAPALTISANARLLSAAIMDRHGRPADACRERQQLLSLLAEDGPDVDVGLRLVHAQVLAELGRRDEASAILRALETIGYQSRRLDSIRTAIARPPNRREPPCPRA
jgi:eukaryotic-like serine/threonine-protein kinase